MRSACSTSFAPTSPSGGKFGDWNARVSVRLHFRGAIPAQHQAAEADRDLGEVLGRDLDGVDQVRARVGPDLEQRPLRTR